MKRNYHLRNMQISFIQRDYPASPPITVSFCLSCQLNPPTILAQSQLSKSPPRSVTCSCQSVKVYFSSKQFDLSPPLHHLNPKRLEVFISFRSSCNAPSPSWTLITTSVQVPGRTLLQGGSALLDRLLPTVNCFFSLQHQGLPSIYNKFYHSKYSCSLPIFC